MQCPILYATRWNTWQTVSRVDNHSSGITSDVALRAVTVFVNSLGRGEKFISPDMKGNCSPPQQNENMKTPQFKAKPWLQMQRSLLKVIYKSFIDRATEYIAHLINCGKDIEEWMWHKKNQLVIYTQHRQPFLNPPVHLLEWLTTRGYIGGRH